MVLLHALLKVKRLMELHIEVCHVDHGLRADSHQDALFVRNMCEAWYVAYHTVRLPAKPARDNLEAWARRHRYEAFSDIMFKCGLNCLVTAHTANDAAETLLMRLIANKELNTIEPFDPKRRCVRPLLENTREQVDNYVKQYELSYVDDPSNIDTTFVRNRVRHELLPVMAERFDPSIVWILAERAQSVAADCAALQELGQAVAEGIGDVRQADVRWLMDCRKALALSSAAVQWRAVQALFVPLLGFSVGEGRARAILQVLKGEVASVSLDQGAVLTAGPGGLKLTN